MKKQEYILAVVTLLMGVLPFVLQLEFPLYYNDRLWGIFLFFALYVVSLLLVMTPNGKQPKSMFRLRDMKLPIIFTIILVLLYKLPIEQKLVSLGYILAFYTATTIVDGGFIDSRSDNTQLPPLETFKL